MKQGRTVERGAFSGRNLKGKQVKNVSKTSQKRKKKDAAGRWLDFSHKGLKGLAAQGVSLPLPKPKRPPRITHVELERLAQTSFAGVEPDIALYLHGDESPLLDVYVVWREDFREEDLKDMAPDNLRRLREYFAFMPPMHYEMLPLPLHTVQKWLRREWADADAVEGGVAEEEARALTFRPAYLYRSADEHEDMSLLHLRAALQERRGAHVFLHPGDVVVVPASYGGVDEYGWQPFPTGSSTVAAEGSRTKDTDVYAAGILEGLDSFPQILYLSLTTRHIERYVADEAKRGELVALLRDHAAVLDSLFPAAKKRVSLKNTTHDDPIVRRLEADVASLLDSIAQEASAAAGFKALVSFLKRYASTVVPHPLYDVPPQGGEEGGEDPRPRGLLFVVLAEDYREYLRMKKPDPLAAADFSLERFDEIEEETAAPREIELEEHLVATQDRAKHYVQALGLSSLRDVPSLPVKIGLLLERAVVLAARYHDVGKLDPRFQSVLRGGEDEGPSERYLAKTNKVVRNPRLREQLYRRLDWPFKKRHEYTSFVLLDFSKNSTALAGEPPELRELVLYLIGTHHGYGRPYFPPLAWEPEERWRTIRATLFDAERFHLNVTDAQKIPEATSLDSGWANRFFDHLERYGIYGAAYLEALLRLADGWASLKGYAEEG